MMRRGRWMKSRWWMVKVSRRTGCGPCLDCLNRGRAPVVPDSSRWKRADHACRGAGRAAAPMLEKKDRVKETTAFCSTKTFSPCILSRKSTCPYAFLENRTASAGSILKLENEAGRGDFILPTGSRKGKRPFETKRRRQITNHIPEAAGTPFCPARRIGWAGKGQSDD